MDNQTLDAPTIEDTQRQPGKITSRWQAFGIHLAISSLIFAVLAYMVLYHWYPGFFFETDGGWEGMRILVAVDLVLGPALTLIVFKAGKPGLKADLTMIGVFQAICLAAGIYVVHGERPLALVYVDGQFNSMTASSYSNAGIAIPDFERFPGASPKHLAVVLPEDEAEENAMRRDMLQAQHFMNLATAYYQPFDATIASTEDFAANARDIDDVLDRDQESQDIPRFIAEHGGQLEDYNFYPMNTRYSYLFLGFHKNSGELAGLLETPGPL